MENKRIYARQVPTEYQESPLQMCGEWPENVYVFGNRHYNEHTEGLQEIRDALENIYDGMEEIINGQDPRGLAGLIWYYLPRESGERYTTAERLKLARLAEEYINNSPWSDTEIRVILRVLEIVRGEEYKHAIIRGCCQGDWQNIIYPASYGDKFRNTFETEYFNTGTEWIIHDDDSTPEDPDEIDGYSVYCYSYDPRAEIAAEYNTAPENVTLYEFDGYIRRASWRAV